MLSFWDPQTEFYWVMRCATIAGSASYVVNGYPDAQVTTLRDTLREAAKHGFSWQDLYNSIYQDWHARRPHLPSPEVMATLMEQK